MARKQSATKRPLIKPFIYAVVIATISGLGYFKYYTGTLDYRMKQHYRKGVELIETGAIGDAAEQFGKAYLTNTQYSALSKSKLIETLQSGKIQAASAEQAAKVFAVHGAFNQPLVDNFATLGWQWIERYQTTDPKPAYTILAAIEPFVTDSALVGETRENLLRQWTGVEPENPEPAVELALIYEAKGNYDALEPLLSPHAQRLGNTEGARILGQIYAGQNRIQEAYTLLLGYTQERLQAFHLAEQTYEAALNTIWDNTLEYLRQGNAPEDFYQQYNVADEARQNAMVQEVYTHNVNASGEVEKKLEAYREAAAVVPVALDLGMVMLRRAQTLSDSAERKQALEAAEETFIAVKGVAGESEEYRLYLGQVYYWLGKQAQGKALFEELLAANNRDIGTLYGVSSILRDLGAETESKALALEAYNKATDNRDKQALAHRLSLLSDKLEEKISWLEKADTREPSVKADLLNLKGREAERANKPAAAAKYYKQAIDLYDGLPKSPSTLNNGALIYFALYGVEGNRDALQAGLSKLDEAIELLPSDSIILLNAASKHLGLACSDVLSGKIDLNGLNMEGSIDLFGYTHYDRQQKQELVEKIKAHKSLIKGLSYLEKAMVLAPKNADPVSMATEVYNFLGDIEGLKLVSERVGDAALDLESSKVSREEYISGASDQESITLYEHQISRYSEQLRTLKKADADSSRAILDSYLVNLKMSVADLKHNRDFSSLIDRARANYKTFPSYSTHRDLSRVLMLRSIDTIANSQPEFADLKNRFDRKMDDYTLLAVALEKMPDLRGVVTNNADFKEYIDLMEKELTQYGKNFSPWEWALVRYSKPALAERLAAVILQDEALPFKRAIYKKITLASPSRIYDDYWYRLISKQEDAADILLDAKGSGMEMPFVPLRNEQRNVKSQI